MSFSLTFLLSFYTLNTRLFSSPTTFLFTFVVFLMSKLRWFVVQTMHEIVGILLRRPTTTKLLHKCLNSIRKCSSFIFFIDGFIRTSSLEIVEDPSADVIKNFPTKSQNIARKMQNVFYQVASLPNLLCECVSFDNQVVLIICWRLVFHRKVVDWRMYT